VCVASSVSELKEQLAFGESVVLEQYVVAVHPAADTEVELQTNNFRDWPESGSEEKVVIIVSDPPLIVATLSTADVNTGSRLMFIVLF